MRLIALITTCVLLAGCSGTRIVGPSDNSVSDNFTEIVGEQIERTTDAQEQTEIIWNTIPPIEEDASQIQEQTDVIGQATDHMTDVMDEATDEQLAPEIEEPLRTDVATIDASADSIRESAADIVDYAALLRAETEKLRATLEALKAANGEAQANLGEIEKLEASIADLESQLWEQEAELKRQAVQRLYTYLGGMFAIGFLMIIGGAVLMIFVTKKGGLLLMGIGVLVVAVSAALTMYLEYVAIAGLVILGMALASLVGYGIYMAVKSNRAEKAVAEQTELLEVVKQDLSDESRKEIFGDGMKRGIADQIQSKGTAKRVAKQRATMKERIEPTFKKE